MFIEKSLKQEINKLLEVKQINMNIADMLLQLFPYENAISNSKIDSQINKGKSEKEEVFAEILHYFGISDEDRESIDIAQEYILNNLTKCESNEYLSDPYAELIKPTTIKENGYELTYLKYAPYQILPRDEIIKTAYPYKEIYRLGYFTNEFKYLALIKNDEIWMSLNPNEINTMKPFIEEANGNVLILGLGLGYVAFMMSQKCNVKTVTIVEKDPEIISIFKKHILNLFPNKSKIKVVQDDAFRYLENNSNFDYFFADLWHNPEDGIPMYIRLESIAKNINKKINYWLDESLKAMKRRCILTIIEEYFMGYTSKDYRFAKTPMDQTINVLYKQIKDVSIKDINDLNKLLEY